MAVEVPQSEEISGRGKNGREKKLFLLLLRV